MIYSNGLSSFRSKTRQLDNAGKTHILSPIKET